MIADEVKILKESGKLKQFISAGIVPLKVNYYYDIYSNYLKELDNNRRCNNCIMQSIGNTAEQFKISESSVCRAIRIMQKEC